MSTQTCTCGFENTATAKFCNQCGKSLEKSPLKCPVCGHVNAPGSRFCENDATPLDANIQVASPAALAPPAVPPPANDTSTKTEKKKTPRKNLVIGTYIASGIGTIRIVPLDVAEKVLNVQFPQTKMMRVANNLMQGDNIEVAGSMDIDGTFRAKRIKNLKTGVIIYQRSSWGVSLVVVILLLGVFAFITRLGGGPAELMIALAVVLLVVTVGSLVRRRRNPSD
jgi:hypothetical protein